jgi:hypothetical protein
LKKEWNLNSTINTANFLSKDFWHQQSRILTDHNYYLIRAGRGSFVILDEIQFPRPFPDPSLGSEDIEVMIPLLQLSVIY